MWSGGSTAEARSLKQLIETVTMLGERGIELRSLKENIDTTTSTGKLMFHIIGAMAEFERDVISERTQAGLDAARARGRSVGRKKIASDNPKVLTAKRMHKNHGMSIDDICTTLKISRASFYRYLIME